jgi:hypothetical protein
VVVIAVALVPSAAVVVVVTLVVVPSIDGEAAAVVGIKELKPRSDAATNRNEIIPAR